MSDTYLLLVHKQLCCMVAGFISRITEVDANYSGNMMKMFAYVSLHLLLDNTPF